VGNRHWIVLVVDVATLAALAGRRCGQRIAEHRVAISAHHDRHDAVGPRRPLRGGTLIR
jgi:hypothetical protein